MWSTQKYFNSLIEPKVSKMKWTVQQKTAYRLIFTIFVSIPESMFFTITFMLMCFLCLLSQKMLRCLLTRTNNAVTLQQVPSLCTQVWTTMVLSTLVKRVTRPWRGTSGARWPSTCYVSLIQKFLFYFFKRRILYILHGFYFHLNTLFYFLYNIKGSCKKKII